jgi:hypothetical protein
MKTIKRAHLTPECREAMSRMIFGLVHGETIEVNVDGQIRLMCYREK